MKVIAFNTFIGILKETRNRKKLSYLRIYLGIIGVYF